MGLTPPARLAVLDVKARNGVRAELAVAVGDALVQEIRQRATGFSVVTNEDIRALLGVERQKQQLGCAGKETVACLAEIGGALGAEQLVVSTLARFDSVYLLTAERVDVRHARVLRSAQARSAGSSEASLLDAAAQVASVLFPPTAPAEPPATVAPTQPVLARTAAPAVPAAALSAEPPARQGHPRPLALALGATTVIALGFAITGAIELADFASWRSQNAHQSVPFATAQDEVAGANTWATVALGTGVLAIAAGAGTALTW